MPGIFEWLTFNIHNKPMRWVVLAPFNRWEHWSLTILDDLPQISLNDLPPVLPFLSFLKIHEKLQFYLLTWISVYMEFCSFLSLFPVHSTMLHSPNIFKKMMPTRWFGALTKHLLSIHHEQGPYAKYYWNVYFIQADTINFARKEMVMRPQYFQFKGLPEITVLCFICAPKVWSIKVCFRQTKYIECLTYALVLVVCACVLGCVYIKIRRQIFKKCKK